MSDLISRSEVNDVIDGLEVYTSGRPNTMKVEISVLQLQRFINKLKNIPTVYDIDKIVEELESFAKLAEDRWTNGTSKYAYQEHKCWIKAIEIVKQGSVSDDVCEWKSTQINNEWKPSCEPNSTYNVFGVAWFKRCPYCGKKIKVVE